MTGIRARQTYEQALFNRIDVTDTCWLWKLKLEPSGYGRVYFGGRGGARPLAHVAVWELANGPVPAGLELDHLCRNRACCNPDHLEAVTHQENVLRGDAPTAINAAKTHCIHGHEFTPENTIIRPDGRECRTCARRIQQSRRQAMTLIVQEVVS